MTIESMHIDLNHRVRLHAALGDPSRLAVVDALRVSDRSPSELADLVGLESNLMAHHLRVLEELGVIVRITSEGDRRKRYVQLVPSALAGLHMGPHLSARRVIFVCTENSARSQLAEAIWNQVQSVPAISAGIEPARQIHAGAMEAGRRRGLDLVGAFPKPMPVLTRGDLVISVCDRAHDALIDVGDIHEIHWSVPDPAAPGSRTSFDEAADILAQRVTDLSANLERG